MNINEFINTTNNIIDCAEIGNYWGQSQLSVQSFGLGENAINFINKNKELFREYISSLYYLDRDIQNSYTLKRFQTDFINFFSGEMISKSHISNEQAREFIEKIKKIEIVEFSVLREIYGITLSNPNNKLSLGDYNIYNFETFKEEIPNKSEETINLIFRNNQPDYLIEIKVAARHADKAVEMADNLFERFELLIRFAIGHRTEKFEVGILSYLGWRHRRAYTLTQSGMKTFSASNHGATEKIPLDDVFFNDQSTGFDYLWQIAALNNANKFQKRLLLAVEWVGQSISESQLPSAFIKTAIALEIIFTLNEKSVITPSILNQLSESTAILLGDDIDSRFLIEKELKSLYAKRSAIVHSGNKDIDEADCQKILFYARTVIITLLSNKQCRGIDSTEKLYELIKKSKYSGSKI